MPTLYPTQPKVSSKRLSTISPAAFYRSQQQLSTKDRNLISTFRIRKKFINKIHRVMVNIFVIRKVGSFLIFKSAFVSTWYSNSTMKFFCLKEVICRIFQYNPFWIKSLAKSFWTKIFNITYVHKVLLK